VTDGHEGVDESVDAAGAESDLKMRLRIVDVVKVSRIRRSFMLR